MSDHLRPYQVGCVDAVFDEWTRVQATCIEAATGTGKCLARGTKVLLFDGHTVAVEDVQVGDELMGPDSRPRTVLALGSGSEEMFRVSPVKGEPFTVNRNHILSLQMSGDRFAKNTRLNISVEDFLRQNKTFKHCAKIWRTGVTFPNPAPLDIDPYFLGVWLGDGHSRTICITSGDSEISDYLEAFAKSEGLCCRSDYNSPGSRNYHLVRHTGRKTGSHRSNPLKTLMYHTGLFDGKHVPQWYKTSNPEDRAKILAGLIDTDGCLSSGTFDIALRSERLIDDIVFIARSLGLAAYKSPCKKTCCNNGIVGDYWRCCISGDIDKIPCLVRRKQAKPRRQKKNVLVTGFQIESVGIGDYFGFTLNGDGLFLLSDFTVTHNTEIFAEIVKRAQPKRALILADRRKLVAQAAERIERRTGLNVGIEMGQARATENLFSSLHAVVSSVQSQSIGRRFPSHQFDLLIVDECHLVKLKNKQVMDVIKHYQQNVGLKILGVTATLEPENLNVFESVAFRYPILEAVQNGYLSDIRQKLVHCGELDYSHVRTMAGELSNSDLAAVVEREKPCMEMCQATLEAMFDLEVRTLSEIDPEKWGEFLTSTGRTPKTTLMFTVSVAHAEMLCNIFQRVMPGKWAWVCGDSNLVSEDLRLRIEDDFASGAIVGVCNCDIYSKGYDNPRIEIVGMGRATKSLTRYKQQAGRGTRVLPGVIDGLETVPERLQAIASSAKPFLTILDFVGNAGRHSLCTAVDIVAPEASEEAKTRAKKKAEKSGKPENMKDLVRASEEEIAEERRKRELEDAARKQRLVAKSNYSLSEVDPFSRYNVRPQPPSSWERNNGIFLSDKQRAVLKTIGVDPDKVSVSCGRKLIGAHFQRACSEAQAKVLKKHGFSTDVPAKEASNIIDALAKAGWNRRNIPNESPYAIHEPEHQMA